jgi:DNA polymerase III alpha subunit (gram-positive type)
MKPSLLQGEVYISVDVETAGPNPHDYSLLSIGACNVDDASQTFYAELQPLTMAYMPGALGISGLSMERLRENGVPPEEALARFEAWVLAQGTNGRTPVFVAFNAAFDWMFLNDYFYRFLGRNPFGHAALDIKSLYMGLTGVAWAETSMRFISPLYLNGEPLSHNALEDALNQAQIFRQVLAQTQQRQSKAH